MAPKQVAMSRPHAYKKGSEYIHFYIMIYYKCAGSDIWNLILSEV